MQHLTIQIPIIPENVGLLKPLLKANGIRISLSGNKKELTIREAAQYCGYGYDHFRRLVIEERKIPFCRPSGKVKGRVFLKIVDLDTFLTGKDRDKEPGRPRQSKLVTRL